MNNVEHISDQIERFNKKAKDFMEELNSYEGQNISDIRLKCKPLQKEADKIIEYLLFSLIARKDNFYGQFIIRMNRSSDLLFEAPAGVSFKGLYFDLKINPIMLFQMTIPQIHAVLIHEIYHVCNNHITRGKIFNEKYPFYLVNIAMDLAINQFIDDLPEESVFLHNIEKFVPKVDKALLLPKRNFEEYLQIFMDVYNNNQQTKEFVDGMSSPSSSSKGKGQQLTEKELEELKKTYANGGRCTENNLDSHDTWNESDTTAGDNESKNVLRKLVNDAKQNSRGTTPGGIEAALKNLFTPPTISWQQILRRYVGSTPCPYKKTITRKDRRQPHRPDIKGRLNDHIVEIVVGIDTSGSMSESDINYALSEVCDIVKNVKSTITVVECDAEIGRVYNIKNKKDIKTKVTGRGGTLFSPVFEYMTQPKNRNAILIFFCKMLVIHTFN